MLKVFVNDMTGAQEVLKTYFTKQYLGQISANGEQVKKEITLISNQADLTRPFQPLESARTRPYHYRAYNLAAMITNARIGKYCGYSAWNLKTTNGSTIQTALDFTLTTSPNNELASELYPNIAAVGSVYGDPDGKYAAYLKAKDNQYVAQAYFLWNQPFSDSGLVVVKPGGSSGGKNSGNAAGTMVASRWFWGIGSIMWVILAIV